MRLFSTLSLDSNDKNFPLLLIFHLDLEEIRKKKVHLGKLSTPKRLNQGEKQHLGNVSFDVFTKEERRRVKKMLSFPAINFK